MATIEKKIQKVGNSSGLIIDRTIKLLTGIDWNDNVQVKCSPNKIVITKIEKGE